MTLFVSSDSYKDRSGGGKKYDITWTLHLFFFPTLFFYGDRDL